MSGGDELHPNAARGGRTPAHRAAGPRRGGPGEREACALRAGAVRPDPREPSDDLPRLGLGESANPDINANGNPHYWFDVKYAKVYVERIRDALVTADPAHSAGYRSRATSYLADLDRLDAEIRAKVTQIPPARRKLVTSHDAFPYYAAAYGLSVVGFTQPEEGKEPSPAELADLVELVKKEQVPAIFSEAQVSPRLAETLAREAGVKTIVTDLPTDSVGAPPADSYLGMMRVVTDKIVQALR